VKAVSAHPDGVRISLQVQPKASRTEIVGDAGDFVKLRVAAPPVDGAANEEIVRWLSKMLKMPKTNIEIIHGDRSRKKVVLIAGIGTEEVLTALGLA
jgi:uncharacterized protein